ncbi:MAG: cysteine dioxygenase family protein [Xanthobacteraceae bacterium]|nr:cysteine dioxygenase family protein [Xanthobacteraceae bacterium]
MLQIAHRVPRASDSSPSAIALLAAELEAACRGPGDAMGARIRSALAHAAREPDLLSPEQRVPQAGCYARHVLASDAAGLFTVLAIVWAPGQFSPAHAHHTWCGYAVVENPLHETLFRFDPAQGTAEPVRTEVRVPGYSCYAGAGLDQIHRLGNSGPSPAISIHAYGVERERIATHVNRVMDVAP